MTEPDAPSPARDAAFPWLWGTRVQRIDSPAQGLFVFTLYDRGAKQALFVSAHPQRLGAGTLAQRPIGLPASAFVRRLRVAAENANLLEAHWLYAPRGKQPAALSLLFARREQQSVVVADFHPQQPNLFILEGERIVGAADERQRRPRFPDRNAPYQPSPQGKARRVDTPEDAIIFGTTLLSDEATQVESARRDLARTQARASRKRVERKVIAIEGDVERARTAPLLRREANLLLCHLLEVPKGEREIELLDEAVEPAEWVRIALDPACGAQQNAERKFSRARRLERGLHIAEARLADARAELAKLDAFLSSLELQSEPVEQSALEAGIALEAPGVRPRARGPQTHVAYRTFEGSGGHRILVGKGAVDNDTLTLTVARPQDLWLHARSVHGAHVIVPRDRTAQLPPELLIDAAHLAAHFSDVRGEATAEIQHTEKRYLRKPKGSAPGAVRIDREKVLLLRVDPERLRRLLASEQAQ